MYDTLSFEQLDNLDLGTIYPYELLEGRLKGNIKRSSHDTKLWITESTDTTKLEFDFINFTYIAGQPNGVLYDRKFYFPLKSTPTKHIYMEVRLYEPDAAGHSVDNIIKGGLSQYGRFNTGSLSGRELGEETYVDKRHMATKPGFFGLLVLDGNAVIVLLLGCDLYGIRPTPCEEATITNEEGLWCEDLVLYSLRKLAALGYTKFTQP